jgi:hypothetical protein
MACQGQANRALMGAREPKGWSEAVATGGLLIVRRRSGGMGFGDFTQIQRLRGQRPTF